MAAQRAREVPLAQVHGSQAKHDEDQSADQERPVVGDRGGVVEAHAAIDLQPGLVEPAIASRLDQHHGPVDPRGEPARRPAPEEKSIDHHEGQGDDEDEDRPPRPFTDRQGYSRQEDDCRQREHQRRPDVIQGVERAADVLLGVAGKHLKEKDHCQQVNRQHAQRTRQNRRELAPDVFPGPQGSRVQQVAQPPFRVLDDRHPGSDCQEERVQDQGQDGELLRHSELGGDPGLGPSHG